MKKILILLTFCLFLFGSTTNACPILDTDPKAKEKKKALEIKLEECGKESSGTAKYKNAYLELCKAEINLDTALKELNEEKSKPDLAGLELNGDEAKKIDKLITMAAQQSHIKAAIKRKNEYKTEANRYQLFIDAIDAFPKCDDDDSDCEASNAKKLSKEKEDFEYTCGDIECKKWAKEKISSIDTKIKTIEETIKTMQAVIAPREKIIKKLKECIESLTEIAGQANIKLLGEHTSHFDVNEMLSVGNENKLSIFGGSEKTNVLDKVIRLMAQVLGTVGVLMLIVAGVMMIISEGDDNRLQRGKNMFFYTIVGLLVAFLALVFVQFIVSILFVAG